MRSVVLAALVLVLAPLGASAQRVPYEKYRLDNGLVVILHEDHTLPRVAVNVWYRVGSKDEEPGRSGFAHLFEHLMFMGTERVPGSQFDEIMEAGGGSNNATTSEDRTNYYSTGPSSLLETLLWLEADRMEGLGKAMTPEKLDLQRAVVRNERRESYEVEPYGKAWLMVNPLLFPAGHPYHQAVIGTHEDLQSATLDEVKAFFASYYVPNNASLVVAGDFEPAAARAMIERYFGGIPGRPLGVRRRPAPVALDRPIRATVEDDVPYARLLLVWHSPAFYAGGDAAMDLAASVLASGKSSRLYKRLVYDERLASEVEAWQESMELGSLFYVLATAAEGVDLDEIERAIDEEIVFLQRVGPKKDELLRAVNALETGAIASLQSIEEKADRLNHYEYHLGEPDAFARDLDRYRDASPDEIRKWSSAVLRPEARLSLRIVPALERPETSPLDEPPAPGAPAAFTPPSPESFEIAGGATVHLWRRSGLPLVSIEALFEGGSVLDPAGREGLAALTGAMLDEGAGDLPALEFSDRLDRLGADLSVRVGTEATTVRLSVLERNLEEAAQLLADAIRRPRLEPAEFDRVRGLRTVAIQQALQDPDSIASLVSARRWYGDAHPLGRPAAGTVETLRALAIEDVRQMHRAVFRPETMTLLVAGDLTAARAGKLLEDLFGSWQPVPADPAFSRPELAAPEVGPTRVYVVDRPGSVQTAIRWLVPAPPRTSPDRLALGLLGSVFGGTFTSRLNANLREDKGWTYGAWGEFVLDERSGRLSIGASVEAEVTGESLAEIAREFEAMRAGPTEAEVDKARRTVWTGLVERAATLDSILSAAAGLLSQRAALDETARDLAARDGLDRERLAALAAEAFRNDRGIVVLVGDRATILAELEGLGLPEPFECDAQGTVREDR